MSLTRLSQCLEHFPSGSAVGCFSVYSLETLRAVVVAAETERKPAVISLDAVDVLHVGLGPLAQAALFAARKANIPMTVHLNHGRSLADIREALELDLPSVMFDGSNLEFTENVRLTRQARDLAHESGAEIEGEFGPLCSTHQQISQVLDFLDRTEIDFLAFSVPKGLSLLEYAGRIELLAELAAKTNVPLVLHNGSRLPESLLCQTLEFGIRKVNVHTDILRALGQGLRDLMPEEQDNPLPRLSLITKEIQWLIAQHIRIFSTKR
ncbi:fructose-bisphosphate aldolase, class II [Desulfonatronum thiosulfatophilum]|uniref:Fructose-bisphosphate aldolase, class II n=1 Tax=Desulfonatronum thiosulfatophilum TaxID=617002 RepID=A0A1G6CS55_9BACT|nr:class II fructose-bisphosphate aldolase [Desulfonatronum thiosulfatophilum]SDB35688.1 fructose-bisphosphate aldolase, class II [Desulfonatronum thiosulfatophilum]